MPTRRQLIAALPALALLPVAGGAAARGWFADGGLAIRGHDPVAYVTEGAPRRGLAAHALVWEGVEWRFASAANRDAFAADPARHAPQFGGWCAWAVAEGYLAPIDPAAWRIVEGRLYLNANARVQRRWERDIPGFIARAQANWPRLRP
jgi:hypothetical protein